MVDSPLNGCKRTYQFWSYWLNLSPVVALVISIFSTPSMAVIAGTQTIAEEPKDTRALSGTTAVLRCRVQNQHGPVTWTKDRYLLGAERSLPAHPRYSMIGSSAHGEYHLEIRDVQLSDDAEYQCQISATATQPFRRSAPVRLTVLVMPGHPRLTPSTGPISAREGRNVTLTCNSDGSKPAAFISWALVRHANGSGVVRKLYAPNESVIRPRGQVNDIQSVLEYAPQRSDDGSYLACMVEHETLTSPVISTIQLRLQYSPKVNVTLNSTEPLLEGRKVVLVCNVDAYPSDNLRYIWYQNQQILYGQNEPSLTIQRLTVSQHHNSVFRCFADNDVGEGGFGEYTLKMKYKPIISSPAPSELFFNQNETVTLRCEADANPPATLKWYKDASAQELAVGNNLTLQGLQYANQGTYVCKAFSDDPSFEPSSRQFKLNINGPPRVDIRSMVYGRKGEENYQLHCFIRSPPNSDTKVFWKRNEDEAISGDDGHYSVAPVADNTANRRSILTITKLEPSDYGVYNCTAQNRFGSDFGVTHLVQAEEFPTYAILGVAGGCLAILAVALALIIANRRYLCRSKSSTNGDGPPGDIDLKLDYDSHWDRNRHPDMYNSTVEALENGHYKGNYVRVPQDNPDMDMLPPPYYTGTPPMTNTTFVDSVVTPSTNGIGQFGYPSPVNGHLAHVTYLDDSMSPTTTTTMVVSAGDERLFNGGHHSRPLSPLSPTGIKFPIAVGTPVTSPIASSQYQPNHTQSNGHFRPYGQQRVYNGNGGGLAPVDLLVGVGPGAMPNGGHYAFTGTDGSPALYYPSTGCGDQPQYYPTGLGMSPLPTVPEVPTPDGVDDLQHAPSSLRPFRSSSSTDCMPRCSSQLSTHV